MKISRSLLPSFSLLLPSSLVIAAGLSLASCGPSLEADRVMTPEERLQEQERLAYEQEQESAKNPDDVPAYEPEPEEEKPFDQRHAQLELRRATLNAITCPDVATEPKKVPKAEADLNIVFVKDGSVKEVVVSPPFEDSPIEECIVNAYNGVKVPPFKDAEHSVPWKADLTGKKRDLMKSESDEASENFFKPKEEPAEEVSKCKETDKKCKEKEAKEKAAKEKEAAKKDGKKDAKKSSKKSAAE
jgi:hypothetical protein